MKIQIASDLHLEWVHSRFPDAAPLVPAEGAELLVLAGDIHSGDKALDAFKDWPVPVVYVSGNHEYYGYNIHSLTDHMRERSARDTAVNYLEMREWTAPGIRVLGVTLWTDYALFQNPTRAMLVAQRALADHRYIGGKDGVFRPEDALARHEASMSWLRAHLAKPFDGKTVVVTHHGPHPLGIATRWAADPLTPAFFSDLRQDMQSVDLWVHGHTHDQVDVQEGRCRIVANPRGYPLNLRMVASAQELAFENPRFNPSMVVEV